MTKQTETNGAEVGTKRENVETSESIASAAGILHTVQRVLKDTAGNRDALPPGSAGSMGLMLCAAMDMVPCSAKSPLKTSIGDVAHILGVSFLEKVPVSPTVSSALSEIIRHAVDTAPAQSAPSPEGKPCCGKCDGRKFLGRITAGPGLAAAGIEAIELWEDNAGIADQCSAPRDHGAEDHARRVEKAGGDLKSLRDEVAELMDLAGSGPMNAATLRVFQNAIAKLIRKYADLKSDVDGLEKDKRAAAFLAEVEANAKARDAMAAEKGLRVPDWRDGASTAETVSGSARTQGDATGGADKAATPQKKEAGASAPGAVPEDKPAPVKPEAKPEKEAKSGPVRTRKTKPGDGTAEVSTYYTQEEAEKLIGRIREWLSGCNRGHRLGDLMTSIEDIFHLSDGQLGELIGVSSRLICSVRHGHPSPSALVRFTEAFGDEGGVK
ncbi:MAG: hypothetical protein J6Y92_09970 [Lentisphaeria bacterium]|nr:hypothetical protein [Lentisphaeria bacterium]